MVHTGRTEERKGEDETVIQEFHGTSKRMRIAIVTSIAVCVCVFVCMCAYVCSQLPGLKQKQGRPTRYPTRKAALKIERRR